MFAGAFLIARDNIGIICDICGVNFSPAHFEPVFNIPLPCCSYLPVPIITSPTCACTTAAILYETSPVSRYSRFVSVSKLILKLCLPLILLGLASLFCDEFITDVSTLDLARGGPARREVGGVTEVNSAFRTRETQRTQARLQTTKTAMETHFGIADVRMMRSGILNCW